MVERVVEKFRQGLDVARLVVDAGEQRVLEEELAARPCYEVAGGSPSARGWYGGRRPA